jgi:general secretion pathway protein C
MGLDAQAKRFYAIILGVLVAAAAYFQASGVAQLVGATVAQSAAKLPSRVGSAPSLPPPTNEKSAMPILARNAFDSVTGPLDGVKLAPGAGAPPAIKNGNDPYLDPPCSGVKVSLITASDDEAWSFAALAGSDGKSQLRRKGDAVGSAQVVHIGWYPNAPEPSPHVWLNDAGTRCLVTSGALEKKADTKKDSKDATPPTGDKKLVPPEIGDKIHKISDTQFQVERSAVPQIIQNYAQLAAGLRTRPTKDGVRLSGIKPNSILSTLGMKNSDVLKTINGYDMGDQDKALEAYAKLKTASKLTIVLDRGGSPVTLDIGIQ